MNATAASPAEPDSEIEALTGFFREARSRDQPYTRAEHLIPAPTLYSLERLQTHLANPLLQPDWLQLVHKGQAVDLTVDALWKTVQTRRLTFIDKERLNDFLDRGASVVLEGLDVMDARINRLLAAIDREMPCALSNCEAFFSQRHNEAYGGHRDSDDVVVLQISGQKRWQVHAPQARRYSGNAPLSAAQMGPKIADFIMQAGDALYVRAGVPHRCTTVGDYSLHLSIDLCDRTPSIEQITHAANDLYNQACAPVYAPPEGVIGRYIEHLQSRVFTDELARFFESTRQQSQLFRRRIGKSAAVTALARFMGKA